MAHLKEKNTPLTRRILDSAVAAGLHDPLAFEASGTINTVDQTNREQDVGVCYAR